MELGGIMSYVFKIFLGNPDIMIFLISFTIFFGLVMVLIKIHEYATESF